MFCAICGFTLPVNLAEGSESVVADSALSTQLKEDDGVGRVDSEPSNSSCEENNLEVRTPFFARHLMEPKPIVELHTF